MFTNKLIKALAKAAGAMAPMSAVHFREDRAEVTDGGLAIVCIDHEGLSAESALPGMAGLDTTAEGEEISLLPTAGKLRTVTVVEEAVEVGIIGSTKEGYELRAHATDENFRYPDIAGVFPKKGVTPAVAFNVNAGRLVHVLKAIAALPNPPVEITLEWYGQVLRVKAVSAEVSVDAVVSTPKEKGT